MSPSLALTCCDSATKVLWNTDLTTPTFAQRVTKALLIPTHYHHHHCHHLKLIIPALYPLLLPGWGSISTEVKSLLAQGNPRLWSHWGPVKVSPEWKSDEEPWRWWFCETKFIFHGKRNVNIEILLCPLAFSPLHVHYASALCLNQTSPIGRNTCSTVKSNILLAPRRQLLTR